MDRKQFTFYESFASALKRIRKKADRADAYDAIVNYALYAIEPDLESMPDASAIAVSLIMPTLATSRRKAQSGSNGGRAKQSGSKNEANEKQPEREYKGENKKENDSSPPKSPSRGTREKFIPPTVDEVREYCQSRNNGIDPEAFVDFYASKGWMVGKNHMKDWKAAVRTWEKNETKTRQEGTAKLVKDNNNFARRNYDMDDLERRLLN